MFPKKDFQEIANQTQFEVEHIIITLPKYVQIIQKNFVNHILQKKRSDICNIWETSYNEFGIQQVLCDRFTHISARDLLSARSA